MGRYLEKTIETLISFWILITASFFLLRLLPGGPFDHEHTLSLPVYNQLNSSWGLDRPLVEQYFFYVKSLLSGQMGISYFQPEISVGQIIVQSFSRTLNLDILALLFIFCFAFLFSWILVRFRELRWMKYFNQVIILMGSLPSLFLGPMLIYLFSFYWDFLPVAFLTDSKSYILPILTLSFRPLSQLTRLLKNAWMDALNEPFIRTAKSKGLSQNRVLWAHALRFSVSPLLSWLPSLVIAILAGSVFIELLFSIPGLGFTFVESINQRDYPIALGATLFYGAITISVSWFSELLRLKLDPRGSE